MASTCPLLNLQPILEGTMSSTPAPPSDAVPLKAGTILSAVRWQTQPLGATGRNVIERNFQAIVEWSRNMCRHVDSIDEGEL